MSYSQTMDTTIFSTPSMIRIPTLSRPTSRWPRHCFQPKHKCVTVVSLLTPSNSTNRLKTEATSSFNTVTPTTKTVYKDNWFDRFAINYLSTLVQDTVGLRNEKSGYESLVVAVGAVFRNFDPSQQRQLVAKALQNAMPRPLSLMIKTLLPPSKFSREYFAVFTTIFFPWLVGPCEVRESEFEGGIEKNVVHIKKCRVLESTNCAGICTNMCKIPSQEFIKNSFGIPVNMVPNFDDMSCEMIFGQNPPLLQDDPVFKQPCYKLCTMKHKHNTRCVVEPLEDMEEQHRE